MSARQWEVPDDIRGATLVVVAASMVALLSAAALAIDVGLLVTARTEAQRVADMAAHAGASTLIYTPSDEDNARSVAIDYGGRNDIRGAATVVRPEDVDVLLDEWKVRVRVHRTEKRGTPIGTFFARIFGVDAADIGAVAAARVVPGGEVNCLLPVAVADRWYEASTGKRAGPSDTWDPDDGDEFRNATYTYGPDDIGSLITLKPSQGAAGGTDNGGGKKGGGTCDGELCTDSNRFEPGWWFLWYPTGGGGAKVLREQVLTCPDPEVRWSRNDWATDKNGNVQSIQKAFDELIARDPDAYWDSRCDCVKDSRYPVSPRLRAVPIFNPETYSKQGPEANFQISGFIGLFVVPGPSGLPLGQRSTYARITAVRGILGGGPSGGPLVRAAQIVE
jgi:hypothetical protein